MEITPAALIDIPELCDLLELLFTQEAEFKPNQKAQARGLVAIIDGTQVGDILVARNPGEIMGMVVLLYTVSTALGERVALLEDMVVSIKSRGMGLGSALLKAAVKLAKNKGCERITLLTDHDNEQAQRFYQRHGFERSSMVAFRRSLIGEI